MKSEVNQPGAEQQFRDLSVLRPLSELYALWEQFGSVPVTVAGRLVKPFYGFPAGAAREEVWRWFEERNPRFIVGEVMQGIRHTDERGSLKVEKTVMRNGRIIAVTRNGGYVESFGQWTSNGLRAMQQLVDSENVDAAVSILRAKNQHDAADLLLSEGPFVVGDFRRRGDIPSESMKLVDVPDLRVGEVGFYRPDPSGPHAVNVVLEVRPDKVVVFELRTDFQFEIDREEWMSLQEMERETAAFVKGDDWKDDLDHRNRIICGRIEALADAVCAKDRAQELVTGYQKALPTDDWVLKMVLEIEAGEDSSVLDDLVHDEYSAMATGVNNEGIRAQLEYLRSNGWTERMIRKEAGLSLQRTVESPAP